MIEFSHVTKRYDDGTVAVNDLCLTAPTGKITILVGPSGCGKTTSLRMINRLIDPTEGSIYIDGKDNSEGDLKLMRRDIGYVIQNAGLFPNKTVIDNISTVPLLKGASKPEAHAKALELLRLVGLDESYASRWPWQLSGGQQQRVGVARALAGDPTCMLMDEPFSAIDPIVRKQLQDEFLRIQAEVAKTIVMVTHDISEALKLGDYVAVFQEGGKLVQVSTPEELLERPKNKFVADLLGIGRGYARLAYGSPELPLRATPLIRVGSEWGVGKRGVWHIALGEGDVPLGWAKSAEGTCTADSVFYSPVVKLDSANLRELLDAVLASPTGRAIVYNEREHTCDCIEGEAVFSALGASGVAGGSGAAATSGVAASSGAAVRP